MTDVLSALAWVMLVIWLLGSSALWLAAIWNGRARDDRPDSREY